MIDVSITTPVYRRIENYAAQTGQTVSAVAVEALTFWMDAMGDPVLEELDGPDIETKIVVFPAPAS